MILIVDASVAVKWFVAEEHDEEARSFLDQSSTLIAPDLVVAEVASVIRREVRRGVVPRQDAHGMLLSLPKLLTHLLPTLPLIARALDLALDLDHPIYDCLYLAAAEQDDAKLVTADAGFTRKLERVGRGDVVRLLGSNP